MFSRKVFLIALVLSALLPARAFSAGLDVHCLVNPTAAVPLGTCITESMGLTVLGLLLSISIVALTFMFGEVLNMGNLKGWYRKELWETTKSMLLVAVIYSLVAILGGVGVALAGGGQATGAALLGNSAPDFSAHCLASTSIENSMPAPPFSTSGDALTSNFENLYDTADISYIAPTLCYIYNAYAAIMGLTIGIRSAKSVFFNTYLPLPIIPFPPYFFATLNFGSNNAYLFTSTFIDSQIENPTFSFMYLVLRILLLPSMLLMQFQYDLLPEIMALGFGVFLPLGVILRGMPFLRPIGGTILAIAIGLVIIYPIILVTFNLPIMDYFVGVTTGTASSPSTFCNGGGIGCLLLSWVTAPVVDLPIQLAIGNMIYQNLNTFNVATATDIGFIDYTLGLNSIYPALNLVDKYSMVLVLQLVLTAMDVFIGVAAVQAIARSLGGTLRLSVGRRFRIA
jgi:hypothetical protein